MRRHDILTAACAALALTACETDQAAPSDGASADRIVVTGARKQDGAAPPPPPPPPPVVVDIQRGRFAQSAPAAEALVGAPPPQAAPQPRPGDVDRERYEDVDPNPVKLVADEPVSTFSIDVDTASYAVARRYLNDGVLPPKDAVRIEEMINYFDYGYPRPEVGGDPFAMHVTLAPSPWGEGRDVLRIGVQGYDIRPDDRPPVNLTLLIDVSGSMQSPDKLPLAKQALAQMIGELDPDDTIAIAVYAGAAGEILPPTKVAECGKILGALDALSAGGSTAGGEGLRLAYALAERNFDPDGVNRVMLLTDGDFNVGIADPERLEDFVSRKRESGVYLSVMGFGRGNYNDLLMQKIAQTGNGTAGYVDTLAEARKLLSDDLAGNLFPIADDVKIQIEFNPAKVAEYRLIGYETRLLDEADFNNDAVDAGDIGAGVSVTALYELTPVGSNARLIDDRRYETPAPAADGASTEVAFLKLRYKAPGAKDSVLMTRPVTEADRLRALAEAPESARFAVAVAGYGQLLRGDPFMAAGYGWDEVIDLAQGARGEDPFGWRAEFVQLARAAETAAAQAALDSPGRGEGGR